jgi:hypothetical protein
LFDHGEYYPWPGKADENKIWILRVSTLEKMVDLDGGFD